MLMRASTVCMVVDDPKLQKAHGIVAPDVFTTLIKVFGVEPIIIVFDSDDEAQVSGCDAIAVEMGAGPRRRLVESSRAAGGDET